MVIQGRDVSMSNNQAVDAAQALGRLEGGVEALKELINGLSSHLEGDRAAALQHRSAADEKLAKLASDVSALRADMDSVKPFTEKWQRWQHIGLGALLTVCAIGSVVGSLLTYFKDQIAGLFH